MASRYEVELKLSSANNLKNVNWRNGPNRPYAVVWVEPSQKCTTNADQVGDTEANWDKKLVIPLPPGATIEDTTLFVDVVHAGSEPDTKPIIGSAQLRLGSIKEDVDIGERANRTLKLKRPSGYDAPSYGAPPPLGFSTAPPAYGASYTAPPPTTGYTGYSAPAPYGQASSGYGQSGQQSYGYGQVEEKKKSKFGGIGTGLAVGAIAGGLGALAIGKGVDIVEDKIADRAAEKVEEDMSYSEFLDMRLSKREEHNPLGCVVLVKMK